MNKKLVNNHNRHIKSYTSPWYVPWSDVLQREADFEVKYNFINHEYNIYVGMQSHFKYSKDEENVWIILPEFLDDNGLVMMDKRVSPPLQRKADMWILNKNNIEFHKSNISVGVKAYMTFFHVILAELEVTKVSFS